MTATAVAVPFDHVVPPPRQGFAAPVLAMLALRAARGSARPLTRRHTRQSIGDIPLFRTIQPHPALKLRGVPVAVPDSRPAPNRASWPTMHF